MAVKGALIVWGGWDGHEPEKVANFFEQLLKAEGFSIEVSNDLDSFRDLERLKQLNLIIPIVTMSSITAEQRAPVSAAVAEHGVGLAGCHGGMCDSFRNDTEWQFMTGGQWVAHPGNDGVRYTVTIDSTNPHEITHQLEDFEVVSEQYYLHTDPGNNVLAYTIFPHPAVDGHHVNNRCKMPQIWTRSWGKGKVFYNALGHHCDILESPVPRELMRRGFLWAAR